MVVMHGQVLCYLRLYAVLSSIMTLLSLHNAIQCRRSWQGCGRCGLAVLPVSVIVVFMRFPLKTKCYGHVLMTQRPLHQVLKSCTEFCMTPPRPPWEVDYATGEVWLESRVIMQVRSWWACISNLDWANVHDVACILLAYRPRTGYCCTTYNISLPPALMV